MRVALVVLCVFVCAACRGQGAAPRVRPVRAANLLLSRAGEDLRCDDLTVTRLDPRAVRVTGCERSAEYTGETWQRMSPVDVLGPRDLRCAHVEVLAPARRVRAATGCGRTLRYDLVCDDAACTWQPTVHAGVWDDDRPDAVASSGWPDGPSAPLTTPNPFAEGDAP